MFLSAWPESSKSTAAQLFYVELRSKMDDFIRLTKSFYNALTDIPGITAVKPKAAFYPFDQKFL